MGLQRCMHEQTAMLHYMVQIRQMMANYDSAANIAIHTDESLDIDPNTCIIEKLMLSPLQLRHRYGIGKTGIYIKGSLLNGSAGEIAIQLQYKSYANIYTTPFLQELIGIVVGKYVFTDQRRICHAYTDCNSALARVQEILSGGAAFTLHLSYGPILNST
jgi:hypothetical protein